MDEQYSELLRRATADSTNWDLLTRLSVAYDRQCGRWRPLSPLSSRPWPLYDRSLIQPHNDPLLSIGLPAIAPLIGALENAHPAVRERPALVLGCFGMAVSIDPLFEALNDENKFVRAVSSWGLVKTGPAILAKLTASFEDSNPKRVFQLLLMSFWNMATL
jgi:HEAT repeat protein